LENDAGRAPVPGGPGGGPCWAWFCAAANGGGGCRGCCGDDMDRGEIGIWAGGGGKALRVASASTVYDRSVPAPVSLALVLQQGAYLGALKALAHMSWAYLAWHSVSWARVAVTVVLYGGVAGAYWARCVEGHWGSDVDVATLDAAELYDHVLCKWRGGHTLSSTRLQAMGGGGGRGEWWRVTEVESQENLVATV
jgi:hypothetical protein